MKKYATKTIKSKYTYFLLLFGVIIPCLFFYSLYKVNSFIEAREYSIYLQGYEIGVFSGLTEGYNNAQEENWNMLSKNPEVVRLLKIYFPDYTTARIAYAVAQAESHGKQVIKNINKNGSWDCGYMQINTLHRNKYDK